MRTMEKVFTVSVLASSVLLAGGYKLPEQSLNSMAKSGANVAYTTGADASYDNPANMSFLSEDKSYLEGGLTLVHLPSNDYMSFVPPSIAPLSGESETENIPIPYFHYVSEAMGDFRWGASVVVPGGLTKRWESQPQKSFVEEFTLKVVEVSPSIAYRVSDDLSVAAGIRLLYAEGVVKSSGPVASRDMTGDTFEFGYNLAMTYKPTPDINLAATYRSNIDIDVDGDAKLYYGTMLGYNGAASVSVPLPATLSLAISKTWQEKFTLELDYERAFWSEYESLEFGYTGANSAFIPPAFRFSPKNWQDTDTLRLGATIKMDNKITAMMGFALDESPVPANTLGFETPDTDAKIFSMGFSYQQTENLSWGLAFLYDSKAAITIAPGETITGNPILEYGGTFSGGGAYLTTLGMAYEF